MSKLAWKPWHQVVQLRPDVRSGELSLSQFATDLYDVIMDRGTSISILALWGFIVCVFVDPAGKVTPLNRNRCRKSLS